MPRHGGSQGQYHEPGRKAGSARRKSGKGRVGGRRKSGKKGGK